MPGRIHLIRHAESEHNISKDFSVRDPGLTSLGRQQAEDLGKNFPYSDEVGLIISSPLRRTIQTTLLAFSNVLDQRYFDETSGKGVRDGAKLLLDPNLQERSDLPCDTGSELNALHQEFPSLDFSDLKPEWLLKEGFYAADDNAVAQRAIKVREQLRERKKVLESGGKKDIVVVTHGVFMKYLSGDPDLDLPKAGWESYELKIGVGEGNALIRA